MKLLDLIEQIKQTAEVANKDLSELPLNVLPGWQAAKNQAKEKLDNLTQALRAEVQQSGHVIFLTGDVKNQAKLAEVAEDEGNAIVVRADALYRAISEPVEKLLGPERVFSVGAATRAVEEIAIIANQLGVRSMPPPAVVKFAGSTTVRTFEDLVSLIRLSVRETVSDDLNALYIHNFVTNKILTDGYVQNVVPVVVLEASQSELTGKLPQLLFGARCYHVEADKADPNKIVSVFNKIKLTVAPQEAGSDKAPKKKTKKNEDQNPPTT